MTLPEALKALEDAKTEFDSAQSQLQIARTRECAATNALNEAQRAFDRAVSDNRKTFAAPGTDWGRRSRPGEPA
jgi:hypothetical protein